MTSPEAASSSPLETTRAESPRQIFSRISEATKGIVKGPLTPEEGTQAVRTVLDGVTALHRQGQLEPVRDILQTHVFAADPARKIIAETLVSDIEGANTGKDPEGVKSLVGLASSLGINDPDKFPDLAARLGEIKVKEKRPARSGRAKPKAETVQVGQRREEPAQAPKGEYDVIPYATAEQTSAVDEKDLERSALEIAFTDISPYVDKLPPSIYTRMVQAIDQINKKDEVASEETARAYVELCEVLVSRGYTDKAIRRLTGLLSLDPSIDRVAELIPILRAFSRLDSKNPAVHHLLGDAYLQHGDYREAADAYKEELKIPPKD